MENKWPEHKLSEFISIKHGFAFKGTYFSVKKTYDCLVTPGNFAIGGGFKNAKFKYYNGPVPENYILKKDDLVVTMTDLSKETDTLGYSALIPDIKNHRLLHNQRIGLVELKNNELDKIYLYFLLRSRNYRSHIIGSATGTTVKHTSPTKIISHRFKKPPLVEQIIIGNILLSIEKKIELNRQINKTLEQMAQALFKSWFVDFDPVIDNAIAAGNPIPEPLQKRAERRKHQLAKPDHKLLPDDILKLFPRGFELTKELGWIPKGWEALPFNKTIDKYIDNRGKTPPLVKSGIPLVEVKHLVGNGSFPNLDTEKAISQETFKTWFRAYLKPKDILISTVGTIGRTSFVKDFNFGIAQNVLGFRFGKTVKPEYMLYTISQHRFQHEMDARLVTTVQASIKRKDLNTIKILVPCYETQSKFSKICDIFLNSQYQRSLSTKNLTKLRDTLLPKLISGELRIPEEALNDTEQEAGVSA